MKFSLIEKKLAKEIWKHNLVEHMKDVTVVRSMAYRTVPTSLFTTSSNVVVKQHSLRALNIQWRNLAICGPFLYFLRPFKIVWDLFWCHTKQIFWLGSQPRYPTHYIHVTSLITHDVITTHMTSSQHTWRHHKFHNTHDVTIKHMTSPQHTWRHHNTHDVITTQTSMLSTQFI